VALCKLKRKFHPSQKVSKRRKKETRKFKPVWKNLEKREELKIKLKDKHWSREPNNMLLTIKKLPKTSSPLEEPPRSADKSTYLLNLKLPLSSESEVSTNLIQDQLESSDSWDFVSFTTVLSLESTRLPPTSSEKSNLMSLSGITIFM
jgi:hypothetical protein